jgi:uncharacterized protein (TIGR02646 family)
MKYVKKGPEPDEFVQWKFQANEDWQPSYQDLPGNIKKTITKALMTEQGYICCYCERRLEETNCHLEHFQPQAIGAKQLDYQNMLCSCQRNLRPGEPRHCGNLKGDWYDAMLLISPLESSCETQFRFTAAGEILPDTEDNQASLTTIAKLGLNIKKLQALRREVIAPFLDQDLTLEELKRFVDGYLQIDHDCKFNPFYTTIRYLFG